MIKLLILVTILVPAVVLAQMGAPRPMNLTDPQVDQLVKRLTSFALAKIAEKRMTTSSQGGAVANQQHQPRLTYSLVKLVSASSQVVSGVNYMLTLHMRDVTGCQGKSRRAVAAHSSSCANGQIEQCNVTIWEQRWLNKTELTQVECSKQTQSQQPPALVGGRQRISNKDPEALKALDFAVSKFNAEAVNERAYFKPAQIYNTYKQIVGGVKYTYMIKLAPTNCEKHEKLSILKTDDCVFVTNNNNEQPSSSTKKTSTANKGVEVVVSIDAGGSGDDETTIKTSAVVSKSRKCKINVLDRPWLKDVRYQVTEVNCF